MPISVPKYPYFVGMLMWDDSMRGGCADEVGSIMFFSLSEVGGTTCPWGLPDGSVGPGLPCFSFGGPLDKKLCLLHLRPPLQ